MIIPNLEEWNEWLQHPCTEAFRAIAKKRRDEIKDAWESGSFKDPLDNAQAIGAAKALQVLEDLDYDGVVITELGAVEHGRTVQGGEKDV